MTEDLGGPLADRLRDIEAVTDAALSRLDDQDLLRTLLERVKKALGADTAAVLLVDRSARQLVATAASGIEEEVRQGVRIPLGTGFAGRIAERKEPVILDRVDHSTVRNPLLVDRGIKSLLGVPLFGDGKVIGVLHIGSLSPRSFGREDVELLQLAGDRAARALRSLIAREDAEAAVALQLSLIPSLPPEVPGIDLSARYVTGTGNFGGDWYDVFVLPSGKIGVVVGDVAGSGLPAAVIMGRMRSTLRAYVLETENPAVALGKLDRKMQYFEPNAMATVLFGVLEPGSGKLEISSAGHLPPLMAAPAVAGAGPLAILADPPIGVAADLKRRSSAHDVPEGAMLCLYTDGLVERRDEPIDAGTGRVAAALAMMMDDWQRQGARLDGTRPVPLVDDACAAIMRAMVGNAPARDDIALLILQRV